MNKPIVIKYTYKKPLTNGGGVEMSESNEVEKNTKLKERLEWYKLAFDEEHPAISNDKLTLQRGEVVEVVILSHDVDLEVRGERVRPYLRVLTEDGLVKRLYLKKKSLAVKIGYLQTRYDSLRGLRIRITAPDPDKDQRFYNVEVLGRVENIDTLPE